MLKINKITIVYCDFVIKLDFTGGQYKHLQTKFYHDYVVSCLISEDDVKLINLPNSQTRCIVIICVVGLQVNLI
jgi:hypothetical protein